MFDTAAGTRLLTESEAAHEAEQAARRTAEAQAIAYESELERLRAELRALQAQRGIPPAS
ncbi:MAG: hypothetical protein ACKV0T_21520 [Planctomycetales bacterium]